MENKLSYIQLEKENETHYEMALGLWLPFIQEVNQHDGVVETREQIALGLRKRIAIQGGREDMHFEIALLEGKAAGVAMFAIDLGTVYGLLERGYGTVMGFYIAPEYRRRGLGSRFAAHIEGTLAAQGAKGMYICPDGVTGEPFWRANGYRNSRLIDPDDQKPIYIKTLAY